MMEEKVCTNCGRKKLMREFYVHPLMAEGRLNKCKSCVKSYTRERAVSHAERVMLTRVKTCRAKPSIARAHKAVEAALACGALVRPSRCGECGREVGDGFKRIEAHHRDYAEPLMVIWVCTPCHKRHDSARQETEAGNVSRGEGIVYRPGPSGDSPVGARA